MVDVERREILADHVHHRVDGDLPHERQPFSLGLVQKGRPMIAREPFADGLQVIAGVEPLGDRADILTERFAVAQECGAGEHVHLRTRIVDVVFPGDLMAREGQQFGQRIAEHRAAAMAHMHRAGRVGGDELHIHLHPGALPDAAEAIGVE